MKNPVTPPGIDPGTVRLVTQCLNYYATPGPYFEILRIENQWAQEDQNPRKLKSPEAL